MAADLVSLMVPAGLIGLAVVFPIVFSINASVIGANQDG
jgi:hypothetical protein